MVRKVDLPTKRMEVSYEISSCTRLEAVLNLPNVANEPRDHNTSVGVSAPLTG